MTWPEFLASKGYNAQDMQSIPSNVRSQLPAEFNSISSGGLPSLQGATSSAYGQQEPSAFGGGTSNVTPEIPAVQPVSTPTPAQAGGLGDFGYYTTPDGVTTGLDEAAFGAMAGTEHGGKLSTTNPTESGMDWGMQGYGGVALGAGQLGLGLASYFDQRNVAKKQKELLGQQVANNRAEMAAKASYRDALKKF